MALDEYLSKRGYETFEGFSQQVPRQVYDLTMLIDQPTIKTAMEIGFNAGHSAEIFLDSNPHVKLTSFDLGEHDYVKVAKEYIDATYPGRHELILGDSTVTIPAHSYDSTYDLIFIDGGHDYEIASADLSSCARFAHKDTVVIMDDTMFSNDETWRATFNYGPTHAWMRAIQQGVIVETDHCDYRQYRGMSWGKYCVY